MGNTHVCGARLLDKLGCDELVEFAEHLFTHTERLFNRGVTLYLVGGPVRDLLCGITPKDLDVTSVLHPSQFRIVANTFDGVESVFDVGEAHGTTGVVLATQGGPAVVEHTTHRREVYTPGSRTPTVTFGDNLVEDLSRRDFTVNAIALDLRSGEIVDPFDGAGDLEARTLRCPGEPHSIFSEDPLRICRLVRFAATRGWAPDPATAEAAKVCGPRLEIISAERIAAELDRVVDHSSSSFAAAVELAFTLEVNDAFLGIDTPPGFDPVLLPTPLSRMVALAHRSGDAKRWCSQMVRTKATTKKVVTATGLVEAAIAGTATLVSVRRATREVAAAAHAAAEAFGFGTAALAEHTRDSLFADLPVAGNDALSCGLKGRAIGAALAEVEERFVIDPSLTRAEALSLLEQHR